MGGKKRQGRGGSEQTSRAEQGVMHSAASLAGVDAMLQELVEAVKPVGGERERFLAIVALTDAYSMAELEPLGGEYRDVCRMMAAVLCREGSPVVEGKSAAEGWAAGIVAAVGFVNFLGDREKVPSKTMAQVAAGFGVSESGVAAKSLKIRKMLDLGQFDPEWTLPSLLDRNPFVWMLETTDGLVLDVRHCTREEQVRAFEMGLIPYVPADRAGGSAELKTRAAGARPTRQPPHEPPPARDEGPTLFDPGTVSAVVGAKPGAADGVIGRIGGTKGRK